MKFINAIFLCAILLISSCEGPVGPPGLNSLTKFIEEPAGENCEFGGFLIQNGIDTNNDGILNDIEVTNVSYVCSIKELVNITEEIAGDNCSLGGVKIETGLDTNNDGILNDIEVTNTSYVCSISDLVNITEEISGDNCSLGGIKIETGLDINKNGVLDLEEVTKTIFVCSVGVSYGIPQSNFTPGQVYKAAVDGLLSVRYNGGTSFGNTNGYIYSDTDPNPTTIVGQVSFSSDHTTVPILKENYWKVTKISNVNATIIWIPFE